VVLVTIQRNFAFPRDEQNNAPASSDGGDGGGAFDPFTGRKNPDYVPPEPSARQSTAGSLGDGTAHGDIASYHRARAAASEIQNTAGSAGFGLPGSVDAGFGTFGNAAGTQFGTTTGGTDALTVRDSQLPDDTNLQAGGRALGA
jgi:hypothetical protein